MITVQLLETDYLAAIRLHRRNSKQMLWAIVSILCYVAGGVLFLIFASPEDIYWVYIVFGAAIFLVLFMVWMHFMGVPRGARRRFQRQKGLSQPCTVSWNDEKLTVDGDDLHVGIPWDRFLKWTEDEQLFLLYSNRLLFRVIPKRAFPDQAGAADFGRLVRGKIGPQGVSRK